MERAIAGSPASPGIVIGPVHLLRWEVPEVRHAVVDAADVPREIARLHEALAATRQRLLVVRARAEAHAGPEEAAIFDVQLSILEDVELLSRIEGLIRQNIVAEKAVDLVLLEWRQSFARHAQPMIRERERDLVDLHIRLLSVLLDLPDHDPVDLAPGAGAILVTHDLTPSLTVQFDRSAIAAIATDEGTRTSHVAILARSLGMPAIVGLRDATTRLRGGELAVLDGTSGMLIVNPTPAEVKQYRQRAVREATAAEELAREAKGEAVTADGVRIVVRANVDLPEEAEQAATSGAEGVGLFRTEFLVVGRPTMPDEEEQLRAYRRVAETFAGRPVVIRTYDIGGDKLPVGGYPTEANPFLGWRAIRMCLDQPELFKVQLRALLRAGLAGDVRVMLPLVVTVDEVRRTRALLHEAAAELEAAGVPFKRDLPLGVMIETPAAAIAADTLVKDVSFFSIGTNDLVQYTLAVDRGNANLSSRFTPLHPAVLRLIARVAEVGAAHGIEVAVCGEMASEPLMAFALVGLGLRHLSVSAASVARVKRVLRGVTESLAAEAAHGAMCASTADEATHFLRQRLRAAFSDRELAALGLPGIRVSDAAAGAG
ncbi:MAG: phosphoenolpyruvate--protein phosphotransferase [Gemmatimonadaceae bacterium]|nr:phosphoenolpyruvate--protein phosphotransferase [Gemmatimonadaceae bacterium]